MSGTGMVYSYRESAKKTELVKAEVVAKPMYGFIKGKPTAIHRCSLPGFWSRLFHGYRDGTLFRCPCGKVWTFGYATYSKYITWFEVDVSTWIAAGGLANKTTLDY